MKPAAVFAMSGAVAIATAAGPAVAADTSLCANSGQRTELRRQLEADPKTDLFAYARERHMSEAMLLDALPAATRKALAPSRFQEVWSNLVAWPDAVTMILKLGNVFEVHGRVLDGEPSKVSQYFNLAEGPGVSGHLRPDTFGAIYLAAKPFRGRVRHEVSFLDRSGENVFSVFVPGTDDGGEQPATLQAFEKLWTSVGQGDEPCP
ncbi:MAG: hypothetical protein FIB04_07845 [Gammaproteobacteria bacterium]|nr:hypothetical protein [Gammaproteobacteria bacterium]